MVTSKPKCQYASFVLSFYMVELKLSYNPRNVDCHVNRSHIPFETSI